MMGGQLGGQVMWQGPEVVIQEVAFWGDEVGSDVGGEERYHGREARQEGNQAEAQNVLNI